MGIKNLVLYPVQDQLVKHETLLRNKTKRLVSYEDLLKIFQGQGCK